MKQFRLTVALFFVGALVLLAIATRVFAVPALCSITGTIYKPDSTPCASCFVTFTPTGTVPQIVGGVPIYPTTVYTTTNASGVMTAISLIQGAAMTVTITDPNGFVSAPVQTSVAMASGETIAQLLANNLLTPGVATVTGFSVGTKVITFGDSPYTVASTDFFIDCDATGGNIVINLPASTGGGRWLHFKKIDASTNTCTLTPAGADTLDGLATYALTYKNVGTFLNDTKLQLWGMHTGMPTCQTAPTDNQVQQFDTATGLWCPSSDISGILPIIVPTGPFDGRWITDLVATQTSPTVTSASAAFTTADNGKRIYIWYPRSGATSMRTFNGTFTTVNATTGTLSSNYTETTPAGPAVAFLASDPTASIQTAINSVPLGGSAIVLLPGKVIPITQELVLDGRNIILVGQGMSAGPGTSTAPIPATSAYATGTATGSTGTALIANVGRNPVIGLYGVDDVTISDMSILGDNIATDRPTACVFMSNSMPSGTGRTSTFNMIKNVNCGRILGNANALPPGFGFTVPLVDVGVDIPKDINGVLQVSNDRNYVENFHVAGALEGMRWGQNQAVEWKLDKYTCDQTAICIDDRRGAAIDIQHMESLASSMAFWIADGALVNVDYYSEEDSSNNAYNIPWGPIGGVSTETVAGRDMSTRPLPRGFVIEDESLHFQKVITPGITGASEPAWNDAGGTTTDGTVVYQDMGTDPTVGNLIRHTGFSGSTGSGGVLSIKHGNIGMTNRIDTTNWISSDNGQMSWIGENVAFKPSSGGTAATNWFVNLTENGSFNKIFRCHGCRGVAASNVITTLTNSTPYQVTDVDITNDPTAETAPYSSIGNHEQEMLQNGEELESNAVKMGGLLDVTGGMSVRQIPAPIVVSATCTAGANTYKYKFVPRRGTRMGAASAEFTKAGCAAVGPSNPIQLTYYPSKGASDMRVYRTVAGGSTEYFAFDFDPDSWTNPLRNTINDEVVDGDLLTNFVPPTTDDTGFATFEGEVSIDRYPVNPGDALSKLNTHGQGIILNAVSPWVTLVKGLNPGVFYRMDDASGNLVDTMAHIDAAKTGIGGTYQQPGSVVDDTDTALTLAGGSAPIYTAAAEITPTYLPSGDQFTVCGAFNQAAIAAVGTYLFTQKVNGLSVATNNGELFSSKQGGGNMYKCSRVTSASTWYFTCVRKAAAFNRIFLGDADSGSDCTTSIGGNLTLAAADNTLYVANETGSLAVWNGTVDEMMAFRRFLTDDEVNRLYNGWKALKKGADQFFLNGCCTNPVSGGCANPGCQCTWYGSEWDCLPPSPVPTATATATPAPTPTATLTPTPAPT